MPASWKSALGPVDRRSLRWTALAFAWLALLAGCTGLDVQQRKWIFQASATPAAADIAALPPRVDGMQDVWIEHHASGRPIRLHALWQPHPDPQSPLLLYLHGARRDSGSSAFRIRQMAALGFAVLAVDYRGFGLSTDELPSEDAVYEDARAAWAWLGREHPGRDRYLFGHSLGGAIAIQLASEGVPAKGLIVEGTFTSIRDVFESMRWGWLPLGPLITQRFDSLAKIEHVSVPILVVHGTRDRLIPPALGLALFERARAPKRLELVEGGSHYSTNSLGAAQYRDALRELFGLAERAAPVASAE
jgi:alpha-beta hydrolase superfamily lysophospholipase